MSYKVLSSDNKETEYDIRIPTREELSQVGIIANEEKWNMSVDLLTDIYDLQTAGFRVAVNKEGNVLGHCCMVSLDEKNAFATGFITRPEFRGKGIGKKLWEACLEAVKGKNIMLNANIIREEMYNRLGFSASEMRLRITDKTFPLKRIASLKEVVEAASIEEYNASMFERLYDYDRTIQPIERKDFFKNYIAKSETTKVALQEGKVVGYVCLRKNFKGFVIMPLYADTFDIARQLLHSVTQNLSDNTDIKVGVPSGNPNAEELFKDIGWFEKPYNHVILRMHTSIDHDGKLDQSRAYSPMNFSYVLM